MEPVSGPMGQGDTTLRGRNEGVKAWDAVALVKIQIQIQIIYFPTNAYSKIMCKYIVDNNVSFTIANVGGRTNSRGCFRLSAKNLARSQLALTQEYSGDNLLMYPARVPPIETTASVKGRVKVGRPIRPV